LNEEKEKEGGEKQKNTHRQLKKTRRMSVQNWLE
jgi:hypothetical protein